MSDSAKGASVTTHVVIVGAGFAGLNCAKRLASDSSLRITLIDKNNYQQFQPLFYQVATGILSPENAAFNLRNLLFHHENVDVKIHSEEHHAMDKFKMMSRPTFCTTVNERVYITASGCETEFVGTGI